jgi:uncharacterized protein (TIGR02147 family)
MDIFEFSSYKKYVRKRIEELPKRGYGQLKKMAEYLGVTTTFVSQVFSSDKSLSLEQGAQVCEFFGLTELETEYFLKLILLERAGSEKLKTVLKNEIAKIKVQAQKISSRLDVKKVLQEEERAIFYSDWYYSAIRLLIGIPEYQSIDSISSRLGLPRKVVIETINFLLQTNLIIRDENGLHVGPSRTHLDADSPFIKMHHTNWRHQALEHIKQPYPQKLHYSAPMTIGKSEVHVIRGMLVKMIEDIGKVIDPAPNEELMCLNLDWFKISNQHE